MTRGRVVISNRFQAGLSLVEVLIAVVLLSILLVPALQALQVGMLGADVHVDYSNNHHRIVSRMETVLAEPFADLEAVKTSPTMPGSYSDAVGTPGRLLVYVAAYDADNADGDNDIFTGPDDGILWIQVTVEGTAQSLQSLMVR